MYCYICNARGVGYSGAQSWLPRLVVGGCRGPHAVIGVLVPAGYRVLGATSTICNLDDLCLHSNCLRYCDSLRMHVLLACSRL